MYLSVALEATGCHRPVMQKVGVKFLMYCCIDPSDASKQMQCACLECDLQRQSDDIYALSRNNLSLLLRFRLVYLLAASGRYASSMLSAMLLLSLTFVCAETVKLDDEVASDQR